MSDTDREKGTAEAGRSRRPLFAANWKMNLLSRDVDAFLDRLAEELEAAPRQYDLLLAPSPVWLDRMAQRCRDLDLRLCAQDVHPAASGAHTGDVSAQQAADAGATWTLCGHSERRGSHHETDEVVCAKVVAAQEQGLGALFCLGETLPEREDDQVEEVFSRQLDPLIDAIEEGAVQPDPLRLALAYEPVWAIGTGRTATPELAAQSHALLRARLRTRLGPEIAERLQILYGGSVKPANAGALWREHELDGFLVGGASLDPGSFLDIIRGCGF